MKNKISHYCYLLRNLVFRYFLNTKIVSSGSVWKYSSSSTSVSSSKRRIRRFWLNCVSFRSSDLPFNRIHFSNLRDHQNAFLTLPYQILQSSCIDNFPIVEIILTADAEFSAFFLWEQRSHLTAAVSLVVRLLSGYREFVKVGGIVRIGDIIEISCLLLPWVILS